MLKKYLPLNKTVGIKNMECLKLFSGRFLKKYCFNVTLLVNHLVSSNSSCYQLLSLLLTASVFVFFS